MDWFSGLAILIVKFIFLIFILFYHVGIIIYLIKLVYSLLDKKLDKKKGEWRYWYIIIGNLSMILVCVHVFNHLQFTTTPTNLNIPYLLFLGAVNYLFSLRYFRWKKAEANKISLTVADKGRA